MATTNPFGLFEFPFKSFGLHNAAQTFQRFMDDILRGLDFRSAYLVDILVFSRSLEEHEEHLRTLFNRLQRYEIVIDLAKHVFWAPEIIFLSYKVSAEGSQPLDERVTHLQDCQSAPSVSGHGEFLQAISVPHSCHPDTTARCSVRPQSQGFPFHHLDIGALQGIR
jgi:hypothetical protein